MLEIKVESNNVMAEGNCWLCEKEFLVDVVTTVFYVNGEKKGYVCDDCFKLVASGIKCPTLEEWEKEHDEMFNNILAIMGR